MGLVLVSLVLASCAGDPPYFEVPDEVSVALPAEAGATVFVGVADLRTDGAPVTLLALDPASDDGLEVLDQWVLQRSESGGGGIGIAAEADVPADLSSALRVPMAGYRLTPADGDVQIVLALRAQAPGHYGLGPVVLSFRVNDGPARQQTFPRTARLCIAAPAPAECR